MIFSYNNSDNETIQTSAYDHQLLILYLKNLANKVNIHEALTIAK